MIKIDTHGYAMPGSWYKRYLTAWKMAFPGRPTEQAGKFIDEVVWQSETPHWDKWWFESFGAKPPRLRSL